MGRDSRPQVNMAFIGLALEWGIYFGTVDNLTMLWLGPIRIGWFRQ